MWQAGQAEQKGEDGLVERAGLAGQAPSSARAMSATPSTDLQRIPGVGKNMEGHLVRLGYSSVDSLKGQDPEAMYAEDCRLHGGYLDRCVLYVYRCAVYFAENEQHEPQKLKWWHWKD